ncbi:response regulator [Megalodesulfovibrio gigas]|nr:response regulator [Megalodesulfovibrio gigas]
MHRICHQVQKLVRAAHRVARLPPPLAGGGAPAPDKPVPAFRQEKGNGKALRCLRILVVEDEPVNQLFLRRLLEKMGHSPRLAGEVSEAMQCLDEERFDLILMDIQLPDMNGLDATRLIRANPPAKQDPDIPIVAVTAFALEVNRDQALAAGMDDHLAKPVEVAALERVIARVCLQGS